MPSFLGRLLGLSFRTELLIMNLVGLVNSTLDWSPLKWTNKLERIWNLSLSQRTLILDTIGEDTIKTVLSWVVITRIVIAHVYTFTYVTNIYPIITWSRSNLLLPWLILSFFKNVVLEVIVIVIGLLIWYETQFSLVVFLEFILVKLVPLLLSCYNWYSNSCLFLQLRYIEKIRTLGRAMRSDSNLISQRLCEKIEDSKYRTRSLTTLLSCESYETHDTQDTISRILDDPNLTLAQKTMKILVLTERDVEEARVRIREREETVRLSAKSSDLFRRNDRKDVNVYMLLESEYEINSVMQTKDQSLGDDSASSKTVSSSNKDSSIKEPKAEEKYPHEANAITDRRLSRNKREGSDQLDTKRTKQMKLCPSYHVRDTKAYSHFSRRREAARNCCSRQSKKCVEKSCSPVKLQDLFNCNCLLLDYPFKGIAEDCCAIKNITLRSSTPKKASDYKEIDGEAAECLKILKSIAANDQNAEKNVLAVDMSVQGLGASKAEQDESDLCQGMFSNYRNTLVDLQDLSSDPENSMETRNAAMGLDIIRKTNSVKSVDDVEAKAESESQKTTTTSNSSEDGAYSTQKSTLQLYSTLDAKKNALKLNLPQYSFDDTSIPRFYKDSMKVFDGCYEQDFDNNSELQCLLEQMKKKKWNLFPSQGGVEMLLTTAFSKDVDNIIQGIENLRIEDSMTKDRYEVPLSKSLKPTPTAKSSEGVQADEQSQHFMPRKRLLKGAPTLLTSSSPPAKDVYTQTFEDYYPRSSFNSLTDAWKHKKRRRSKDQSGSTVSMSSKRSVQSTNKAESCSSVTKDRSRSPVDSWRRVSSKASNEKPKKQSSLTKSQSDKSICECKMQKLEAKYCASSESRLDGKDDHQKGPGKQKVDSFGTIPLVQVARTTYVESMVFRKKPPLYPKKNKRENPSQTRVNKKSQDLVESKQLSVDRQSTALKTKSRLKSIEKQEALEMRALKAYNEVTLLKDKKELESKKKSSGKHSANQVAENLKSQSQARKGTLDRAKKDVSKNAQPSNKVHLDKENLLVDATTETDPSIVSSSKDTKLPLNVPGAMSFGILNDKYPCPKLLSVNKVAERLLDNFDRLHGSQTKQDTKKGKPATDVDYRKQYTKYSKPKSLVHDESLSVTSSKKLEGTQKGRELERTPAKQDVRNSSTACDGPSALALQLPRVEASEGDTDTDQIFLDYDCKRLFPIFVDSVSPEARDKDLLMTIKSTVNQDIASSCSSSTIDQVDEVMVAFDVNLNIEEHMQALLGTEEIKNQTIEELDTVMSRANPSLESVCLENRTEIPSGSEENGKQIVGSAEIDAVGERRRLDLTDFTRSIDVSCLAHGVVLANTNAEGKSRPRDIVDDRTARLVHNAFFYTSMESLLDLPPDTMAMEDMLNDSQLEASVSDEFVCQSSNEAIDVFTDELPLVSHQGSSLEQTILATIRDTNQPEGSCDLCIITIDREDPSTNPETENVESFSTIEGFQQPGISGLQINDVLSSIAEILRNLNVHGLDLSSLAAEKFEMLQHSLYDDEPQNEFLEIGNIEEEEKEEKVEEEKGEYSKENEDMLRFIKEDIFTNIKFPIIIDRSKLMPDVFTVSNEDPQQLSAKADYVDSMRMNLLLSIEERKEANEEKKKTDETVEELSVDSGQETETLNRNTLLNSLNDSDISSEAGSLDLYLDSSELVEENYNNRKTILNETFEIVRLETSFEEEMFEEQGSTDSEDRKSEESMDGMKIEEADINIQREESTEEEIKILLLSKEESDNAIEEIKNEVPLPTDTETKYEETKIVNIEPDLSLKIIFMFWLIVLSFYMRYFYQKIWSFAQISRTTSNLKPFDVHTVSTSTSTLLDKIKGEVLQIEEDDSTEESNIDFEGMDEFRLDENLQRTLSSIKISVLPNIIVDGTEDDMEDFAAELEETTLTLSKHVSEFSEASLLPSFDEESVRERYNYVLHYTELSGKEETSSESLLDNRDSSLHPFFPINTYIDDDQSNFVDKPEEIVENEPLPTLDLEEQKLLKLPKKEIESFQFKEVEDSNSSKSLLEDNHERSREDQLNVSVKTETEEEALEHEKIQISDRKVQPNILVLQSDEENSQNESNVKNVPSANEETLVSEGGGSTEQNVEGAGSSVEPAKIVSSTPFETNLEEIDSFNSAYTRLSKMSDSSVSFVDLDNSSMEDFSIASIENA